ncbi:MAG: BA14K family protein [Bradyrhizobium sp.]
MGYGAPGWEAYCLSRYRSFDPISGTYRGYDGRRHYCR